jgi:hypothetical protein
MIIPRDDCGSFIIPSVVVQIYDIKRTNQQMPMLLIGSAGNVIVGGSLLIYSVIISLPAGKEKIHSK